MLGRLVGRSTYLLVGWLGGWSACVSVGRFVCWLVGLLAGWLVDLSAFGWCRIHDTEAKYYADSEDAYDMRKTFKEGKKEGKMAASGSPPSELVSL